MLDNQEVAVLTKLNELAERRGLKAYDFVATFKSDKNAWSLEFEIPAQGNTVREERFAKMLEDLGGNAAETGKLTGEASSIIDALDRALEISPRSRIR